MSKLNGVEGDDCLSDGDQSNSGDSGVSSGDSHRGEKECQDCDKENREVGMPGSKDDTRGKVMSMLENRGMEVLGKQEVNKVKTDCTVKKSLVNDVKQVPSESNTAKKGQDDTSGLVQQKVMYQPRIGTRNMGISLEDMLEEDKGEGEEIPQEDIRMFLDGREDMVIRRQQLRENLKKRFAQLCVNSATTVN